MQYQQVWSLAKLRVAFSKDKDGRLLELSAIHSDEVQPEEKFSIRIPIDDDDATGKLGMAPLPLEPIMRTKVDGAVDGGNADVSAFLERLLMPDHIDDDDEEEDKVSLEFKMAYMLSTGGQCKRVYIFHGL